MTNSFNYKGVAMELYRVTKDGGVVVWIVGRAIKGGSETDSPYKQRDYFKKIGFRHHDTILFVKRNPMPNHGHGVRYNPAFEYMFVFSKGKPKTINLIKEKCKHAGKPYIRQSMWGRERNGKSRIKPSMTGVPIKATKDKSNVWEYTVGSAGSSDKFAKEHPAVMPEQLAADLIASWSNPFDTILDPMTGSGTVGKMAKALNRNFRGIEISQKYMEIARRRIDSAMPCSSEEKKREYVKMSERRIDNTAENLPS